MVDEKKQPVTPARSTSLTKGDKESLSVKESQFPSLDGAKDVEVAKRSVDGDKGDVFTKKYVVLVGEGVKPENYDHTANVKETREFMLHAGLRPTGDVKHVKTEAHPDGVSTVFTYEGPVVPAVVGGKAGKEPDVVLAQQLRKEDKK